jgi:uncharacterized membrane protein
MKRRNNKGNVFLNSQITPKVIIFGFALLNFLTVLIYVVRYQQEFAIVSDHWNPVKVMYEPALLLLAAALLLPEKLWGYLISIVATARVVYVLGYLGLFATSAAHDHSILSSYVLKRWFVVTYESQPQYLLELLLAGVIAGYVVIRCSRRFLFRGTSPTRD